MKKTYAEYLQYLENQEIDNAIATLERIQQQKEQEENIQ